MKLTLPIAALAEVTMLADALEASARAHRQAAIGAAEAIEGDRADGEVVAPGAADQVLAALARAGALERLAAAARTAHDSAVALPPKVTAPAAGSGVRCPVAECRNPAVLGQLCVAHQMAVAAATPVFLPAGQAPDPLTAAATALDPESEPVDIFAPGAIT